MSNATFPAVVFTPRTARVVPPPSGERPAGGVDGLLARGSPLLPAGVGSGVSEAPRALSSGARAKEIETSRDKPARGILRTVSVWKKLCRLNISPIKDRADAGESPHLDRPDNPVS